VAEIVDFDQDLDQHLEFDGDVEVDPVVDLDLGPRPGAPSTRDSCASRGSTCKVDGGVDVAVFVKVFRRGRRQGQRPWAGIVPFDRHIFSSRSRRSTSFMWLLSTTGLLGFQDSIFAIPGHRDFLRDTWTVERFATLRAARASKGFVAFATWLEVRRWRGT